MKKFTRMIQHFKSDCGSLLDYTIFNSGLHTDQYVVCPKCNSIYDLEQCTLQMMITSVEFVIDIFGGLNIHLKITDCIF